MSHTPAFTPPRNLYVGPRFRPTKGLSLAVTVLLALCAAADVLSVVAHVNLYSLLGNVSDGGFASYRGSGPTGWSVGATAWAC